MPAGSVWTGTQQDLARLPPVLSSSHRPGASGPGVQRLCVADKEAKQTLLPGSWARGFPGVGVT